MSSLSSRRSGASTAARPDVLETLGPWELVARLAEGQVAEVFAARPAGSAGSPCYALKRLRQVWRNAPDALASLVCEAQAAAEVSHPHVVPLLAAELRGEEKFLVFPLFDGRPLGCADARRSPSLPEVLWIARQAAQGLAALHAAGWRHGDVKPQHVLVSSEGHATLIDLGFARPIQGSAVRESVRGTPRYLAPECLTSTLRVDQRSDLYSLGAVLFEWLAGRPPFEAETLSELARRHRQDAPTDLRALAPGLPRGVVELVRQLLAKSPERRPNTAQEVVDRLWPLEIAAFADWESAA